MSYELREARLLNYELKITNYELREARLLNLSLRA
jgi:hypothetical protein